MSDDTDSAPAGDGALADGGTATEGSGLANNRTQFLTLVRREVLRFVRRPYNTFLPPIITNTLYFSVFGVILGSRIGEIAGVSYLQFVLPGLGPTRRGRRGSTSPGGFGLDPSWP